MSRHKSGWELLGDTSVEDFKIFRTRKSRRLNPRTGAEFEFFLIDGHDWANVIALTKNNEVVLVKQYRHGIEDFTLELPGGCVEAAEDPKNAALRELKEEAGFIAEDTQHLGSIKANPAMMSVTCHLYLARNAQLSGNQALDPGENIEVVLLPLEKVLSMIASGQISHALHVAAFGLFLLNQSAQR